MKVLIDGVDLVLTSVVKVYKGSSNGMLYVPKKFKDKKVKIVILNEKI